MMLVGDTMYIKLNKQNIEVKNAKRNLNTFKTQKSHKPR